MLPDDDYRHGTRTGYDAGCRQDCCRDALRRAHKNYHLRALRMGGATTVPADRAAEVLTELAERMSLSAIAKPLGTSHSYISGIIRGRIQRISPAREADILRLAGYTPTDTSHINPLGAQRRLQALHALGYTWRALSDETGIGLTTIKDVVYGEWPVIEGRNHAKIADAYDRLSMRLPSSEDRYIKRGITRARMSAQRRGWPPPLAWDDIDSDPAPMAGTYQAERRRDEIDEAVVARVLNGDNLPTTVAEKREIVRRWRAAGRSLNELERRTGWQVNRYGKGKAA